MRKMTWLDAGKLTLAVGFVVLGWTAALAELSVSEYAVGTAVEDRVLKGKADSFVEGTTVFFWTRVTDGEAGDRIRHVWIHEGKEQVSIGLNIGGSHWRTYSSKKLHPGLTGRWTVEARAEDDRVLAKQEFSCTPPPPAAD